MWSNKIGQMFATRYIDQKGCQAQNALHLTYVTCTVVAHDNYMYNYDDVH